MVFVHGFIDEVDFEGLFDVVLFFCVTFEIENGNRVGELLKHFSFMILILEPIGILKGLLEKELIKEWNMILLEEIIEILIKKILTVELVVLNKEEIEFLEKMRDKGMHK